MPSRRKAYAAVAVASGLFLAACGSDSPDSTESGGAPLKVALISSYTGNFTKEAASFENGFRAAIDYYTDGTGVVDGHEIQITTGDDTGVAAVGVSVARSMIADGATVVAGITDSAIGEAVVQQTIDNKVLYMVGASGSTKFNGLSDLVVGGINSPAGKYLRGAAFGDMEGKTVVDIEQDYAYGQAVIASNTALFESLGATVKPFLLPKDTTDFTPALLQIKEVDPDFIYTGWGGGNQGALYSALASQGLLESAQFTTDLEGSNAWPSVAQAFGPAIDQATFVMSYFDGATGNDSEKALQAYSKEHDHAIETVDQIGWDDAAILVHGVEEAGVDDTTAMAVAMKDWSFDAPGGTAHMRGEDNLMLTPGYLVKLVPDPDRPGGWGVEAVQEFSAEEITPPVVNEIP